MFVTHPYFIRICSFIKRAIYFSSFAVEVKCSYSCCSLWRPLLMDCWKQTENVTQGRENFNGKNTNSESSCEREEKFGCSSLHYASCLAELFDRPSKRYIDEGKVLWPLRAVQLLVVRLYIKIGRSSLH
ncbi:hypothetical protein Tcan_01098, partial [Toxocara canis]